MKTLGEFYRDKVSTRHDVVVRELPSNSREARIEKGLFGWSVYAGDELIEARSEEEARYLKVFIEAGAPEIAVPQDDVYLAQIVPELERLKSRHDDIINYYVESVLSPKMRHKIVHRVWSELLK
jgi:hypothetical protein